MGLASNISRAIRWQILLSPLGYTSQKANRIMAVFIGYLVNITIPRSGELSRALVVNRYDGVPFDKALGTIIAERIVDLFLLLLFVITAFILHFDTVSSFLITIVPIKKLILILFLLGLGSLFFIWRISHTKHFLALKIKKIILGMKEGLLSVIKLKQKTAFILHTLFIWTMYFLMFFVSFYALPETSKITFSTIITAFVVGSFAITFTNGGFGSYPFFISEILALFGISLVVGTAFGWIVWISQFFMTLLAGGLSFLFLPLYNNHKNG